jgi:homeobox protein ESX1
MLAGGLLFGSVVGYAGSGSGAPPIPPVPPTAPTAPIPPIPPTPPTPHTPGMAPLPPMPPMPPMVNGLPPGINVTIHDGKILIDGVDKYVDQQIDNALKSVQNPSVPPQVRAKVEEHLKKLREKLKKKLAKIDVKDLGDLGDELGEIGDEIGSEMDDFGSDMDAWGDKLGKDIQKQVQQQLAQHGIHSSASDNDDDDDNDIPTPDVDDDDDMADAVRDLGDLSLSPDQRTKIQNLRADTDKQVASAKKALDTASDNLKKLLENGAGEAEVSRAIDEVSAKEATIRKARILAWMKARNYLDNSQRKKVEDAAKKHK